MVVVVVAAAGVAIVSGVVGVLEVVAAMVTQNGLLVVPPHFVS